MSTPATGSRCTSRQAVASTGYLPGGPPVGAWAGSVWPQSSMDLAPGDSLVVVSDGVLDVFDSVEAFTEAVLTAAHGQDSAQSASRRHPGPGPGGVAEDDVTVVVVRRLLEASRSMTRFWTRLVVVLTVILGLNYVAWRWAASLNWDAWWIAVPLVVAETYSLIDVMLFGLTVWKLKIREAAPAPPADATVDVFITTYNEDLDMVMTTALAAQRIRHPHSTWILDDGARPGLKALAEEHGLGYVTRSEDWTANVPRHAKAGNLNNALMVTHGEFLLILDADQIPEPDILEKTLGYFTNHRVALVQTPQYFSNVPAD